MELKQALAEVTKTAQMLLIVPYGIETWNLNLAKMQNRLLIVPYGIETSNSNR